MPCYHPLRAYRGDVLPSGKRSVVFRRSDSPGGLFAFPHKLPCGQCIGCRLDYSLDWATRCLHEASMHEANCFITLTYDAVHLPRSHCHVFSKRECAAGSLCVDDWQNFVKRLRRKYGRVRYFHAGEYGERFGRPHYHALLFGLDFADRELVAFSGSGSQVFGSKCLQRLWPYGYSSVGDVTFESAAYVARYCLKKVSGKKRDEVNDDTGLRYYERLLDSGEVVCLRPEYVTMSRRPGIAKSWYDKFKSDVYPHDYCVVRGGVKMPPPRYFDGLYELENPLDMKRIKVLRSERCGKSERVWNDVLQKYQELAPDREERLSVKEVCKAAAVSYLRRGLEVKV